MPYHVMLLDSASKDLESIYRYLKQSAGEKIAFKEIETLEAACESLAENPKRGNIPEALERTGAFEYRPIISGAARMIYQVANV